MPSPRTKKTAGPTGTLASHIRAAHVKSGLSVYAVAKETGLATSALNRFLNGTRDNIRIDIADRLMHFYGLVVVSRPKKRRAP